MIVDKHTAKTLLTPTQFAKLKGVGRLTVYNHIAKDKIKVVQVGMLKDQYIDWKDYKGYQFDVTKKHRSSNPSK